MLGALLLLMGLVVFVRADIADVILPSLLHIDPPVTTPDMKHLHGRVRLNNEYWETDCKCSKSASGLQGRSCNPTKVKVFLDKGGLGMSAEELQTYIGDVKKLDWAKVSSSSFSCVDGRRKDNLLSTPGADAGEFILALHIYSSYFAAKTKLDFNKVNKMFIRYVQTMEAPHFIMCTDDSATSHISQQLSIEGLDLLKPRKTTRKRLLQSLLEPDNIGDMHLRLMLKNANMYNVDPELIKMFLRAYFLNLWEGDIKSKLKLVLLVGAHEEKGFIEIRSNAICTQENLAPLMSPMHEGKSMFVNHIDAIQVRRAQLAYFFATAVNMHSDPISTVSSIDQEKLFNMINREGLSHLEMTGTYIGKELPFYTINLL